MRNVTVRVMWILPFLLVGFIAGCGQTQSLRSQIPAVIATVPGNSATAVALNTAVTASFNVAMAPATINMTTFTLTGPGAVAVTGAVTYAGTVATFTPAVALAANTPYTATITTGAQTPGGKALAANFVWSFTTGGQTVISTVPASGTAAAPVNTLVSAVFSEAMNPATISGTTFTLAGPGVTPVAGVVTYAGTTATFTPTAVLAASTLYTATITTGANDPAGAALAANFVWTFTTAGPPTVLSTVPATGATAVAVNSTATATFSEAMNSATINATTFTLTGPGVTPVVGLVTYAGTTATFTPTTSLAGSTLFTATVTTGAKDPTGNALAANYVWTFTTASRPAVTSTNPARAAINVALNQKITATFSEPMSSSTILAAGTFTVAVTAGGANVPGMATYDAASHAAIFAPSANLAAGTQFTATITTAAQDPAGDALPSNYVWNFTTGGVATATGPTLLFTNPASAATLVPLNQKIAITFSNAMNPASISPSGAITVLAGVVPVAGTVTYDTASNTAIFTPAASLLISTVYTVTVSPTVTDLAGHALISGAAPNPWSFTTGTTTDTTAPTVTLTSPAGGATLVPIDATINTTFSEAMNPATITTSTFLVTATATGTPISGTVAYEPASQVAVFTPSANLAASTQYTATISPVVQDLGGNALVAGLTPNPWSFTTGTAVGAGPASINLGTAGNFAVMANAAITTSGGGVVNGDVGLGGAGSDGLLPAQVNGTIYGPGGVVTQAEADLLTAYNTAVALSASPTTETDLGGLVLHPGLYVASTTLLISANVTLDAQGDPNAVFVFKVGSSLTTAGSVILAGGAKASNIFWQIGVSATIANGTTFNGSILADTSITAGTTSIVNGRLFAGSGPGGAGSVTLDGTSVTVPQP